MSRPGSAQTAGGRVALPGITDTTVSVGYYYIASAEAVQNATGTDGTSVGDARAQVQAVAKWINAHGGIAGRQLKLIPYEYDISSDSSTQYQAACSTWTEDNKVAVGIGTAAVNQQLLQCMAKAGGLLVGSAYDVGSRRVFEEFRDRYYTPASIETVTVGRTYVDGLADMGFFGKSAKVGVVYYDAPETVDQYKLGMLPALKARGLNVVSDYEVYTAGGLSDFGGTVRDAQAAELKFRSDGVTHVLFADINGGLALYFMQAAESQGYRGFKYGLSSASAPALLSQQGQVQPQLLQSVGVGWRPAYDVNPADVPPNDARNLCGSIMKRAGQPSRSGQDLDIQLNFCSSLFFVQLALNAARDDLSPRGVAAAVAGFGQSPATAAAGFTDVYAAGKPWGGASYRPLSFVADCDCFRYAGQEMAVSK